MVGTDLVVDVVDIIKIVDLILEESPEEDSCEFLTADVNGDEQVNVSMKSDDGEKEKGEQSCLQWQPSDASEG